MTNTIESISSGHEILEKTSPFSRLLTAVAFFFGLIAIPVLAICYILSKILKKTWTAILSSNFPNLMFVEPDSVRTLLDTHRNHGIIHVLLLIKGTCDPALIKQTLEDHIVEKRDKKGDLLNPILRLRLVSCWGNYAWAIADEFDINNHVVIGSTKHRGRPVNEHNLQEYVSGIASKFLLNKQPAWHITIIPNIVSNEPTYGILVRVHHLVLEEGSLNIGDFLCLKPEADQFNETIVVEEQEEYDTTSPLTNLVVDTKGISALCNRLNDSLSNHWNEFVSDFDPITSPELSKKSAGFFECLARILISFVSAYKDTKKYSSNSEQPIETLKYFRRAFNYEKRKRNLTLRYLFVSFGVTLNPLSIVINVIRIMWWINFKCTIKIPIYLYQEYLAVMSCVKLKFCNYPNTATAILYDYLPLLYDAGKEAYYIASLIYSAPATIIREIFLPSKNVEEHHLQQTSSCGRKVVAWSETISRKYIREIAIKENVTETEVLLTMVSACIKEYFHHAHLPVPRTVSTITRVTSYDKLLSTYDQRFDNQTAKGVIFLTLPLNKMNYGQPHEDVQSVSNEIKRVVRSQPAIFTLTSWQNYLTEIFPSVYSRIFLNYMTRKFSVSILEVMEGKHNIHGGYRKTIWNDTVTSLLYWRPPQSNTGMSLTIQRYGDTVCLNVMADSLLSPKHHFPARHWTRSARKLHGKDHNDHENHDSLKDSTDLRRESLESTSSEILSSSISTESIQETTSSVELFSSYRENSTRGSNSSESQIYESIHPLDYSVDDFLRDIRES